MVEGDQSVVAPEHEKGAVCRRVCLCVHRPTGRLPVRLVSERLDETGAAVVGLRGQPSVLGLEGWCLPWYQVGQDGEKGMPRRSQ